MASEEDTDWRGEMTLLERQRFMYIGKYACDVTFVVGEIEEKVYAHSFILVSGSAVFEQTLRNLDERGKRNIRVKGFSAEIFDQLLQLVFTLHLIYMLGLLT